MNAKQRAALVMLVRHGERYGNLLDPLDENPRGVITCDGSRLSDGRPWINWQTAYALERRGFAVCQGAGEESEIIATAAGMAAAGETEEGGPGGEDA